MKFNWGTAIIIFFCLFAGSMTFAVVATTRHPPQLVQKDYYALDLNYQERLDKKQHTAALAEMPTVRLYRSEGLLEIKMPAGMRVETGAVKCYRSATTRDDVSFGMKHDSVFHLPANNLTPGRWHIELDRNSDAGTSYFWETTVG